ALRLFGGHPRLDGRAITQVKPVAADGEDGAIFPLELARHRRPDHAAMARDPDALAGKRIAHELRAPSSATFLRSEATISFTSIGKVISCFQPRTLRALLGSPSRRSTSVGRK